MNTGVRPRGPPNGPAQDGRPGEDTPNGGTGQGGGMSRAEKFEDEKRRIIETCFAKKDTDGSGKLLPLWIGEPRQMVDAIHFVRSHEILRSFNCAPVLTGKNYSAVVQYLDLRFEFASLFKANEVCASSH